MQKELDRIQQRILLLNEMLNNAKPNERFAEGDAYDVSRESAACEEETEADERSQQIAQKSRQVQPKLQKWIEESAENNPDEIGRAHV